MTGVTISPLLVIAYLKNGGELSSAYRGNS